MNYRQYIREKRRNLFEVFGNPKYSRPGLNGLDTKLARYLTNRGGLFIEAGGNDGFTQSNTYYLEKFRGWHGILVEGIPQLCEQARRRRPQSRVFNCALVPFDQEGQEVEMVYGNLMSLVVGAMGSPEADDEHIRKAKQADPNTHCYRVKVPGRTLSSILDECLVTQIDFLSLDVEGYEAPVLRGIDFDRHRPNYLCIETRHRAEIEAVILPYYTMVEEWAPMDVLYQAR